MSHGSVWQLPCHRLWQPASMRAPAMSRLSREERDGRYAVRRPRHDRPDGDGPARRRR